MVVRHFQLIEEEEAETEEQKQEYKIRALIQDKHLL